MLEYIKPQFLRFFSFADRATGRTTEPEFGFTNDEARVGNIIQAGESQKPLSNNNLRVVVAPMQHRSLETTRGYVTMAQKVNRVDSVLFVPTLPTVGIAESG